jgi:cytochrome P450
VLNGYDLIKEALVKRADVFSDRPYVFIDKATGIPNKGVTYVSGSYWKEQRAVTVAILRTIGMGKNVMAEKILTEATSFTTYLSRIKGTPTNIETMVYVCVSNVICSILFGQRFEYDDKDLLEMMKKMKTLMLELQNTNILNFFPWLENLPGDLFNAKLIGSKSTTMLKMIERVTKAKQRDGNNFFDGYTQEMKKQIESGVFTSLDNESLYKIMLELFEAGTETSSTTINWSVLYMVVYPDVQEKVYQEIVDKVGTERPPTMQDKTQLTYLNAVITETQRLASIVSLSFPHLCSEEISLSGYTVPNGAYIITNLDSVLHETTTWGEDAMSFRPERFIDDNGKLEIPEEFTPFGIGRRACLGEALAKMELFLFLSSMIQKFKFLPPDPNKPPAVDYVMGVVAYPTPYKVVIEERIVI